MSKPPVKTLILPATPGSPVPANWHDGRAAQAKARTEKQGAEHYNLPESARVAVDTALALGEPLLVTGAPGTGKTTLAWYLAKVLGVGEPYVFQVQSTSQARDLRYHFDELRRFHDAYHGFTATPGETADRSHLDVVAEDDHKLLEDPRIHYLAPGELWKAIAKGVVSRQPQVLLIDEVDKAPRDFPNDLLRDIDQLRFAVPEVGGLRVGLPEAAMNYRPVVVITSNEERELPAPFLRRCICLNLALTEDVVRTALEARSAELKPPTPDFLKLAAARFMEVHGAVSRRKPGTAEAIVWARALKLHGFLDADVKAGTPVRELPDLSLLVKDAADRKLLGLDAAAKDASDRKPPGLDR